MNVLAIGTEKGGYFLERSGGDHRWTVSGPAFPGWKVSAFGTAPDGTYLAGLGSNWFGASVHRSTDLANWQQVEEGPVYPPERKLNQIWAFHTEGDRVWAGVDEAGLFYSDDHGLSWSPVPALNEHPEREHWSPGFGGLCAHHILSGGGRLWVGISAVGVFRSADGGASFVHADEGVTPTGPEDEVPAGTPGVFCVHGLVADPGRPDHIWRQDHQGVYRSTDGGDRWEKIEDGLPAAFGFPIGRHHPTGTLFVVPLAGDDNRVPVDGRFAVYRSPDDGAHWEPSGGGWPEGGAFATVLRNAMAVEDSGLVAVGTTGGQVYLSDDVGDSWQLLPFAFPRILAVTVF
jgi:hypothetical protein